MTPQTSTRYRGRPDPPPRIVGLDLHPDIFDSVTLEGTRPLEARVSGSRGAVPVAGLERWARENLRPGDLVVCEAGSNSFELLSRLRALGHSTVCLESRRVGQIRESSFNDDRSSAEKIARIYLSGLCKVVWEPDARTRGYRELLGAHLEATRGAVRAGNSLREYLSEHGLRLPRGTRVTSARAEQLALGARGWSDLERALLADLFEQVRHCGERKGQMRKMMGEAALADARVLRLMKLFGINLINAFALVATVGDARRFASPKKLCAYLGVSGCREKSGKSVDVKKGCSAAGRADIRALLVQAAQAVLNSRRGGALREWGWRVFARRGRRNIAVIAVARKLAVQAWYEMTGRRAEGLDDRDTVRRKLSGLCTLIQKEEVGERGFASKKALCEALLQQVMPEEEPSTT